MGLGRRPGPAGYVMLGSLPLFSSGVPAWGSCLLHSLEVEELGSRNQPATPCFGPQAGRRRLASRLLDPSTLRLRNSTNEPGMSMKTKDKVKKSRSRRVKESTSREPRADRSPETVARKMVLAPRLFDFSTPEFREQSENVYENKGQGQKVEKSRS